MPTRDEAVDLSQKMSRKTGFPPLGVGLMDGSYIKVKPSKQLKTSVLLLGQIFLWCFSSHLWFN